MPANSQQGKYLGMTLVGFTAFPAGLYVGGAGGKVMALVGLLLLVLSALGLHRIKESKI